MKDKIEFLYISAICKKESADNFSCKVLELIGEDEERKPRTSKQMRSKWKYLTSVANCLNEKGLGFKAHGVEGELRYTKDMLNSFYWETLKKTLYPDKKRQLNSKEYANVVEHIQDLFALVFDIHEPFPNITDFLNKESLK